MRPGGFVGGPMMGGKAMGGKPSMMADGGGIGAPSPIGGGAPDNDADDMQAGAPQPQGTATAPPPESLHYHDDPQNCQTCQYMGDDGQCSVLQMQVSPEGGCSAFQMKGGQGEGSDMGMPGEDSGTMGGPGGSMGTSGSFGTSQ